MQQGWGFPTKIIEALACGKPTIATPIGARSIERDYKLLQICELNQFAQKICQALKNCQSVATGDFEKLKNRYSWSINIQKLANKLNDF